MNRLETYLAAQANQTIAVAACDFESGQEILVHPDVPFHPASTIKVHVMMEVFRQAELGVLALEDRLPLLNSFTSIADGSRFALERADDAEQTLYPRLGGTETIAELTRLMIVRSSNLATNILLERIGAQNVDVFLQGLGIDGVRLVRGIDDNAASRRGMNNSATARGLTRTMKLIAEKQVVSARACEQMIEILLDQEFNESIPARLPASARVAHKTGWTGDVYHDTGIVYRAARQPYVISILTRGFAEDRQAEAHACMAEISRIVYDQFQ